MEQTVHFMGKRNSNQIQSKKRIKKKCQTRGKWHAGVCNKKPTDDTKNETKTDTNKNKPKSAFSAIALKAEMADSNGWYLDSGASAHMTPNKNILMNSKKAELNEILAANNSRMLVKSVVMRF